MTPQTDLIFLQFKSDMQDSLLGRSMLKKRGLIAAIWREFPGKITVFFDVFIALNFSAATPNRARKLKIDVKVGLVFRTYLLGVSYSQSLPLLYVVFMD